eukprot:TRINITY_DN108278_c0_g1_i1.p1 TRINITY_DN108278_c0_g1~~TRINITY_DN108278_c0_g1_i1.p1  ORF type:complete len:113 (+),score=31.91 TRINITY_DN108278_c0_g1_i1:55-393(+)
MQAELNRLENHNTSLDGKLRSLESLEAFGNDAAELAQMLKEKGSKKGSLTNISDSIEALTELLREDVMDCQKLQATQVVAAFEGISSELGFDKPGGCSKSKGSNFIQEAPAR